MKACITFLLLFFLGLELCYCQNETKLSIPIIKENTFVDSILKSIVRGKVAPTLSGHRTNYHWILFSIDPAKNDEFSINAFKVSKSTINLLVNRLIHRNISFGYFKCDDYFIFVREEKSFNTFYIKLPKAKSFDFLYKLDSLKMKAGIPWMGDSWNYKYKNGRFSLESIPTIR